MSPRTSGGVIGDRDSGHLSPSDLGRRVDWLTPSGGDGRWKWHLSYVTTVTQLIMTSRGGGEDTLFEWWRVWYCFFFISWSLFDHGISSGQGRFFHHGPDLIVNHMCHDKPTQGYQTQIICCESPLDWTKTTQVLRSSLQCAQGNSLVPPDTKDLVYR